MKMSAEHFPESEVVERLQAFFAAMGQWEANCKKVFRSVRLGELEHEAGKSQCVNSLKDLFRAFCTTWESPARARYGIKFSTIPTYGVDLETVLSVEIAGSNATVITQQSVGPKDRLVYRLSRDGNQWRIVDNRKRIESDNKQVDWDL